MTKHDEARNWVYEQTNGSRRDLRGYINEYEQLEKEYGETKKELEEEKSKRGELEKDVKRYLELKTIVSVRLNNYFEYKLLREKLLKVVNQNE